MQKFIAIPMPRYNDLIEAEKSLRQATNATLKNEELQERLFRTQHANTINEPLAKPLDSLIPRKAVTLLPPISKTKKPRKPPTSKKEKKVKHVKIQKPLKKETKTKKRSPKKRSPKRKNAFTLESNPAGINATMFEKPKTIADGFVFPITKKLLK